VNESLAPRHDFPLLADVTYLNAASMGLVPLPVQEQVAAFDRELALRGTTWFDEAQEVGVLDRARNAAARLLNASADAIAITTSATEAFCQVAWWLRPARGTNIVSIDLEFPSVTYPWFRVAAETGADVRLVSAKDDPASLSLDSVAALVDDRTAVICVSQVQFATGHRFSLDELARLARAHNATLVIDATQSAGIVSIDVQTSGVDVLVAGGYKWLGAMFGAAICYLGPTLLERLDPPFVGWRSTVEPYALDAARMPLANSARRLEFSTMSYGAGVALGAAVEYILDLGIDRTLAHDLALATHLMDGLEQLGATMLTPRDTQSRAGIVTARFPGRDGEEVAARLNEAGVIVSPRFGSARFSTHVFNHVEDVNHALSVVERVLDRAGRQASGVGCRGDA
jgi:cysteine desulfurase / selenocysteine lyase